MDTDFFEQTVFPVPVKERLDQIGLSDEEKRAVNVKLAGGVIDPRNWNILDDVVLADSLRELITQGKYILFLLFVPHSKFCIIYLCFCNCQYLVLFNAHLDSYLLFIF
jgi:hypothetical protein